MNKKIIGCVLVGLLMVATAIPLTAAAEDPNDPEIKDRRFDVKLFGFFGLLPQTFFKHIDIVSAWFDEDSENPDYLYISLETRSLKEKTEMLEALYKVNWYFDHERYGVIIKIHTDGMFAGFRAYKDLGNDNYENYYCEGIFDIETSTITWEIPKEFIGDPDPGDTLTSTSAGALLRPFDDETGKVGADFFKDLTVQLIGPPDERYGKDYQIKY